MTSLDEGTFEDWSLLDCQVPFFFANKEHHTTESTLVYIALLQQVQEGAVTNFWDLPCDVKITNQLVGQLTGYGWPNTKFADAKMLSAWQMAGWKNKINNSSTTKYQLWRNAGPSAFQLQETMLKNDKRQRICPVINYVTLLTYWTPLVQHCGTLQLCPHMAILQF